MALPPLPLYLLRNADTGALVDSITYDIPPTDFKIFVNGK